VAPCAVCIVHVETRSAGFLFEPPNHGGGGFPGLGLKIDSYVGDLGIKITATVSWFEPQNQVGFGLSVAPQNQREDMTAWDTGRDLAVCFA
jgi:hypothetical protein